MINNMTLELFDNSHINKLNINLDINISLPTSNYSYLKNNRFNKQVSKKTEEVFKDIKGYEGHYQVSNEGDIKSLKKKEETILKPSIDKNGYSRVSLYKKGKGKKLYVHRLVIQAFEGEVPKGKNLVVDHIDNDKSNNKLVNLQVISSRKNSSKDQWRRHPTSLYTGVCYSSAKKKWESSISVNGSSHHLGYFNIDTEAALEYRKALEYYEEYSDLKNYSFKIKKRNPTFMDENQLMMNFYL